MLHMLRRHLEDKDYLTTVRKRTSGFQLGQAALEETLAALPAALRDAANVRRVHGRSTEECVAQLHRCWVADVGDALESPKEYGKAQVRASARFGVLQELVGGYEAHGKVALTQACMSAFLTWLEAQLQRAVGGDGAVRAALEQLVTLRSVMDLRAPELAYPMARTLTRQIHLHVGPTNSGKTHGALTALARARTGIYAGPLRLLAHEVWERLNEGTVSPGIPPRACNLKTGEEVRVVDPQAGLVSCTVEMVDPTTAYDVAVIDEIQMIGDLQRGGAWTQAVLGVTAKEIHICGEASVVGLMRELGRLCGDEVHVHEYKRLTALEVGAESLGGDVGRVRRGDCVVAFSRTGIFRLKQEIEARTGLRCAVAYGALPPETKSEQARKFNSGELDVMVASDAIGMGLNLRIRRVIFDTLSKWDGERMVPLSVSQIKQIAGRAGRYGTQGEGGAGGEVVTKEEGEMAALRAALEEPVRGIRRAVLEPRSEEMSMVSYLLGDAAGRGARGLEELYVDMGLLARVRTDLFMLADFEGQSELARIVEYRSRGRLTQEEKETWTNAPVNTRDERVVAWMGNAVEEYARGALVEFEKCAEGLGTVEAEEEVAGLMARGKEGYMGVEGAVLNINTLMLLESHHRALTLYMWLSYRFPVGFCYEEGVLERKRRTEGAIEYCLEGMREQRARRLALLGRVE
ncbi:RNA helicase [Malassezia cuniculi]|uniref:RNA helicase n=1 Tax=Malassezia cuniculi TaxID=948313 RepID=A0AAF0EN83_9BASI|nr:RNA helicase [Malassezia cuniculi]